MDLSGIPFTFYSGRHAELKSKALIELNLIADLEKERLLAWIKERRNDIQAISENKFTTAHIAQLLTMANQPGLTNKNDLWSSFKGQKNYIDLVNYLEDLRAMHGIYSRIKIAEAKTGLIFLSTDKRELGNDISDFPYFTDQLRTDEHCESNLLFTHQTKNPILHFSRLVRDETGKSIAVLVMEVNTEDIIKPILYIDKGLGEKAEVLLVNQNGNMITSLKRPLPKENTAALLKFEPLVLAVGGKEGMLETEDYRGDSVLAAYRYLRVNPQWGWGMVVKRDKSELFEPLRRDIFYTFLVGIAGILVFSGFTVYLSKKITDPIRSLSLTAEKVSKGDLDARTPVGKQDEVGTLALTFNSMVDQIQNWQKELEQKVSSRTAELMTANENLKSEINERKIVEDKLRQYQKHLRSLASELSMAEERERRDIAIGLHDHIVQNLAFSKIKLCTLSEKNAACRELNSSFQEIIGLIDQTIQSTRSLTFELSPPILYELGFEPAIAWLSEHFSKQHNIAISFKDDKRSKPLDDETNVLLFRSIRELLVNTIKHAQAKTVQISLERKGQYLWVTVEDNGLGFDPVKTDQSSGFGLFSLRERLDYHGVRFNLESTPGKGTKAAIIVPLTDGDKIVKEHLI